MSSIPTQRGLAVRSTPDPSQIQDEAIGDLLLEEFEPTAVVSEDKRGALIFEGYPNLDKVTIGLPAGYGIAKGIQAFATNKKWIDPPKPRFHYEKMAFSKKGGLGAVGIAAAAGLYCYFGQDDSEIKVTRSKDDGKLDITAYRDEQGFHFLSNKAQVASLTFKKLDPPEEPVLQFATAEQAGAIFQTKGGLIKDAQTKHLTAPTKDEEKDPVKITAVLIKTHKELISRGQTAEADTILESLNDLAKLGNKEVNSLISAYVKAFSQIDVSDALKTLRETLPAPVEPDQAKKPNAVSKEPVRPSPPPAGTAELTDEEKEELRQLEEKNKK